MATVSGRRADEPQGGVGGLTRAMLSNAEISTELVLGEATVKSPVGNIFAKFGLRDREQAVVLTYESGLVRPLPRVEA